MLLRLPDSTKESFELILPFTPAARPNMTSWMAANSDPGSFGQLTAYTFPTDRTTDGPEQVFNQLNQDPTFSTFRTLLGQQGSSVGFGDFLVIPIADSLIYVTPVYVRSASSQGTAIPELKRVIVVNGNQVGVGTTLTEALNASTNGQVTAPAGTGTGTGNTGTPGQTPPGPGPDQLSNLLNQALAHFTAADTALKNGDLATYQTELATAQQFVKQASDLVASTTATTATTAAGTGTPASTSPTSSAPTTASTAAGAGPTPTTAQVGAGTTATTTSS